jgi:hypothetical protein
VPLTIFILFALATWRVSNMIVNEDGPFLIFNRLRARVELRTDLFSCVWCASIWVGLFFTAVYHVWASGLPDWTFVVLPFAFSAVACLLDSITDWIDAEE